MSRVTRGWLFVAVASLLIPIALPITVHAGTVLATRPASAPANVTVKPGNARAVLAWDAVEGATGYQIFRASGTTWQKIASTAALTYTSGGLVNGTTYTFHVAAYNSGGAGPVSADVSAMPLGPPLGVTATAGDQQVTLTWVASTGALSYEIYRSTSSTEGTFVSIATGVTATTYLDGGLTNGTRYYYRLKAVGTDMTTGFSALVSARPLPPPPATAPGNLTGTPGNARVTLAWEPVDTATSYRIFRSTTGFDITPAATAVPIATVTTTTFRNSGLVNGTAYSYRVTARNMGGDGPYSAIVTVTPIAPPAAPADATATAGDAQVTISWTTASDATSYRIYRGTGPGRESSTAVATGLTASPFVDHAVENGPTYYYKLTAVNAGGESPRSIEVSATPEAPPLVVDPEAQAAFRLLRQSTWGPRPGDIDHVKQVGLAGFVEEQLAAAPSDFPNTLYGQPIEATQEHFMRVALTGPDQLRQRVAWALHKIWVVSAVEVTSAPAIVTYYRLLMNGAFGNYRDLMRAVTLNPAMGRYLNMLNNRSQQVTGTPPNENYPREVMQLFALGTAKLNPDATPIMGAGGAPIPSYTEADVKALARIFTGWTFGDGDPATVPKRLARENYKVPMEPVAAFHDDGEKSFLGVEFAAHQSASQDLEQALDTLFNHPNVGPFVSRQLIQQLVTSNPSGGYVADIAAVFNDNGAGVRGDLAAVVRAIVSHREAQGIATPASG